MIVLLFKEAGRTKYLLALVDLSASRTDNATARVALGEGLALVTKPLHTLPTFKAMLTAAL
jgi:hypothetical protein